MTFLEFKPQLLQAIERMRMDRAKKFVWKPAHGRGRKIARVVAADPQTPLYDYATRGKRHSKSGAEQ